jgi:hypothetical protein
MGKGAHGNTSPFLPANPDLSRGDTEARGKACLPTTIQMVYIVVGGRGAYFTGFISSCPVPACRGRIKILSFVSGRNKIAVKL